MTAPKDFGHKRGKRIGKTCSEYHRELSLNGQTFFSARSLFDFFQVFFLKSLKHFLNLMKNYKISLIMFHESLVK